MVGQLFSAAALRRYSPEITRLVDSLAAELGASPGPIALVERMRRFAFAVIASVVLGLEGEDSEALFADFEIWTRALFSIPLALPGSPFARALQARGRLLKRLRKANVVRAPWRPISASLRQEIAASVRDDVDLLGSIYELMGIDPEGKLANPLGLPLAVTPNAADGIPTAGRLKEIM